MPLMEAAGTSGNTATAHSGRTRSGRTSAYAEPRCACARCANLRCGRRYRERCSEDGESEAAWHLLLRFRFRGQTEIDAAIVVLSRGGSQVKLCEQDLVMASRRQV